MKILGTLTVDTPNALDKVTDLNADLLDGKSSELFLSKGTAALTVDGRFAQRDADSSITSSNLDIQLAYEKDFVIFTAPTTPNPINQNYENVTNSLTIKSTGRIGIGRADPSTKLHLHLTAAEKTAGLTPFIVSNSADTALFQIDHNGKVSIGKSTIGESPTNLLNIFNYDIVSSGGLSIKNSYTVGTTLCVDVLTLNMNGSSGSNNAELYTNKKLNINAESTTINGNVGIGIGTTAPASKLDILLTGTAGIASTTITKVTDFAAAASFGFRGVVNNGDGVYFGMGAGGGNGIPAGIGFMREAEGWNTAIAFYTNNVTGGANVTNAMQEKMRITSAGNVLIGKTTDDGSNKLQVQGNVNINGSINLASSGIVGAANLNFTTDTTQQYYFGLSRDGGAARFNGMKVYNTAGGVGGLPASKIGFFTDITGGVTSTERLTITEIGNVGIGTSSPLAPFEVRVNTSGTNDTLVGTYTTRQTTGTAAAGLGIGNMFVLEDAGGNNIGTGGIRSYWVDPSVGVRSSNTDIQASLNNVAITVATFTSAGNLLIGKTADDGSKLQVGGSVSVSGNVAFPIGTNTFIGQTKTTAHLLGNVGSVGIGIDDGGNKSGVFVNNTFNGTYSSQDIRFLTTQGGISGATERMRINVTGNVLIGKTTDDGSNKLQVEGGASVSGNVGIGTHSPAASTLTLSGKNLYLATSGNFVMWDTGGQYGFNSDSATRLSFFSGSATERMRIDSSGNVGIGTISPTEKLHVVGNILATGTVIGSNISNSYVWVFAITSPALTAYNTSDAYNASNNYVRSRTGDTVGSAFTNSATLPSFYDKNVVVYRSTTTSSYSAYEQVFPDITITTGGVCTISFAVAQTVGYVFRVIFS